MSGRKAIVLGALISIFLCTPVISHAQQGALDDALRWFPPGTYEGFLHVNRTFRPDDELSSMLIQLVAKEFADSMISKVPFLSGYENATLALANSVDIRSPERQTGKKRRVEMTGFMFFWREMVVLRGPDLAPAILAAEKDGRLEKLKASPAVYMYSDRGSPVYIHLSQTGEVLLCENRNVLAAMMASGMGTRLGILDDPDVAEMLTFVPSAPVWFLVPVVHKKQAELNLIIEEGAKEEDIDKKRKSIEAGEQFYAAMVDAEDDVVYRELFVFSDSDAAEYALNSDKELDIIGSPFSEEALIDTSKEANGRVITVLRRYSLDKLREISTNIQRQNKEKKEKKSDVAK